LQPRLENRTAPIKTLLMNQEIVAGLGNIYANEACYAAEIDPTRSVQTLTDDELAWLAEEIVDVLETAVDLGGSTINDFRGPEGQDGTFQENFFVYGRENDNCVRCGGTIRKIDLAGRSTFFCPVCQE
jgi:formamidopyrimidine-DNA glycosylase